MKGTNMANTATEKIKCPKCGHEQEITIYRSVNGDNDEKEKARIMTNQLFTVDCEQCEEKIPLLYNCLYHDACNHGMYWLLPAMTDTSLEEMNEVLTQVEQAYPDDMAHMKYRYRRVATANELREKILISEQNLDDCVIELLKVMYLVQLSDKIGTKVVSEVLFDVIDDIYYIEIFYEDQSLDPGVVVPDMEIYKKVKEEYLPLIQDKMTQGFLTVDFDWAKSVLFPQ